jgi:P4 family phage/plasmid primase-like protien
MTTTEFFEQMFGHEPLGGRLTISYPDRTRHRKDGSLPWISEHCTTIAQAVATSETLARDGCDVYFGLGLRGRDLRAGRRGDKASVKVITAFFADADLAGPNHANGKHYFPDRDAVLAFADSLPLRPTLIVWSGGGAHFYWLLREPWVLDTPEERDAADRQLKAWGNYVEAKAKEIGIDLDPVQELSRVLRVPGTLNHKTTPAGEVTVIRNGGPSFNVSEFAELAPVERAANTDTTQTSATTTTFTFRRDAAVPERVAALLLNDPRTSAVWSGRHAFPSQSEVDLSLADAMIAAGLSDQEIVDALVARRRERGDGLKRQDYFARTITKARAGAVPNEKTTTGTVGLPEDEPALLTTQKAAAYRVAQHHAGELRIAPSGALVYTGMRWEDDQARALALGARSGRYTLEDAAQLLAAATAADDDKAKLAKELVRAAKTFEQGAAVREILKLVAIYLPIAARELDADKYLFNTLSGTLDLRTRRLRPHDPRDYITQLAPVMFDPAARCPTWDRVLRRILSDTLVAYLQKLFGLCLSGNVSEQKLFFAYGSGENGKSVVLGLLLALLGSYGRRAMSDLLLSSESDRHSAEIAILRGSRAVVCQEVDRGRRWRSALMKELTGEPDCTARLLYQNPTTFPRTWKTIISANYQPETDDNSHAFWRRFAIIPFVHRIPPSEQIPFEKLMGRLTAELPGILNWAIEGFAAWESDGLGAPPEVVEAVEKYRAEADTLSSFVSEVCYTGEGASTAALSLWEAYETWIGERGLTPLRPDQFKREMVERGYFPRRGSAGIRYYGLTLRGDLDEEVRQ